MIPRGDATIEAEVRRPNVLVIDTGLAIKDGLHPVLKPNCIIHGEWLDERVADAQQPDERLAALNAADDEDEADADGDGLLERQSGHGTFVAGVVAQHCPDANIHVSGGLSSFGVGDDETVGEALFRALARPNADTIDLVVMSLGGYTDDDRPPPLADWIDAALAARAEKVEQPSRDRADPDRDRTDQTTTGARPLLVVAAAGNAASPRKAWPAALPSVVAVGGLGAAGPAPFTNFGGWVDACAPAVEIVSCFFDFTEEMTIPEEMTILDGEPDGEPGDEQAVEPTSPRREEATTVEIRDFNQWATWSGTSFAAPAVAAEIANRMIVRRVDAITAWDELSDWRRPRHPDLGIIFTTR